MFMWIRKCTSLGLIPALWLICLWGCAPRLAPVVPAGVTLSPGRYLTAYYRAPDFTPDQAAYILKPFTVETALGFPADAFQTLFMQELTQAWEANGLTLSPQGDTILAGVVQYITVRGGAWRFITGKIEAELVVSGAITRGDDTLFAFQDRFRLPSPVKPGPAAPKETELLLRQVARAFASHLLNELLLYWPPDEGK
jgi:hypothetical protein